MDSVRSHQYDYDSPVAMSKCFNTLVIHTCYSTIFFSSSIVAALTAEIRYNQHNIFNNIAHGRIRKQAKLNVTSMIKARVLMIRNLRERDYKQYEWLLERLDLQYKPKPNKHNTILIARKEGLRRLTDAYCNDVREQRLDEYRTELEAQQVPFLEQKLKNLIFIRNEQIEMKVDVTISQEQIDETKEKYEQLKKVFDANKSEPTKKKWRVY